MAQFIHLVRHGAIKSAGDLRCFGRTDLPLTPTGEAQARALAPLLGRLAPTALLTSPAQRARQTAALALPGHKPVVLADLQELDFGDWEGRTYAEVAAAEPDLVKRWTELAPGFAFPGGESVAAFNTRILRVGKILAEHPADSVAVFSHAGPIRGLICHFLGLAQRVQTRFRVAPTGVVSLRVTDGWGSLQQLVNPEMLV